MAHFNSGRRISLRLAVAVGMIATSTLPSHADGFTQSRATQVQLTVNGPSGTAEASRIEGVAISGSGINASGPLNLGTNLNPQAEFHSPDDGGAFTLSIHTFVPDSTSEVTLRSLGNNTLPAYSQLSLTNGGVREGLAGSVSSHTASSITAGGPGTNATLIQSTSFSVFDQ